MITDQPIQILIIDEQIQRAKQIAKKLRTLGYEIIDITSQVDEGIHLAVDFKPDLIMVSEDLNDDEAEQNVGWQIKNLLKLPLVYISEIESLESDSKSCDGIPRFTEECANLSIQTKIQSVVELNRLQQDHVRKMTWMDTTIESIGDGLIVCDESQRIVRMNAMALKITGWQREDALQKSLRAVFNVIYEDTGERLFTWSKTLVYDDEIQPQTSSFLLVTKDQHKVPIEKTITPIRNDQGEMVGSVVIFRDISLQRQLQKNLEQMAVTDELSGLYNRVGFFALSKKQMDIASRLGCHMMLMYIDLNKMKAINDEHGHHSGDQAIQDTARILEETFRDSDVLARIGGDEFIALASFESTEAKEIILDRLQVNLDRHNDTAGRPYKLSMSYGVVVFDPRKPRNIDELISKADQMMYKQKKYRVHSQYQERVNRIISERNTQTSQIMTLLNLSAMINSSLDIETIKDKTIEAAMVLVDAEAASLLFVDEERNDLFFDTARGEKGAEIKTIRIKMGQGIAGWVAEKQQPLIINDPEKDERFFKTADKKFQFKTRNIVCLPVKAKGKVLGVLEVLNKRNGAFFETDVSLLEAMGNQIAVAIENSRLYEQLKETFYSIIYTLAETIEKRDPYTAGHTRRVRDYSLLTGKELGLPTEEIDRLELAAVLHDIGKIGVRDDILLKTDRLDADEFEEMKKHTTFASEILKHVDGFEDVLPGILYHHERFDGTGYPRGLKGEEIDILARIIAVCDSFDAMTTNRPYTTSRKAEEAILELENNAGGQFDPNIVNAFLRAYDQIETGELTSLVE